MKRKIAFIVVGFLMVAEMSVAQETKVDTAKALEIMRLIMEQAMLNGGGGSVDNSAERHKQDSIRNMVETKYKPGTPAPDFHFEDLNGNKVSLKDLKGNYLFLDVWATWCGPCKKEIPFLQKLEEKMKGKKITFVSISVDSKRQDWEKMVKEEHLGGVQLFAGQDKAFMKEFEIEFIPRFILIDKKGKMVKIFMSRPSEPETEEFLMGLKGI